MSININKPVTYLSKEFNSNLKWYKKYFKLDIQEMQLVSKNLSKKHTVHELKIILESLNRIIEGFKNFAPFQLIFTTVVTLFFGVTIGIFNFASSTSTSNLNLLWNSALKLQDRVPIKVTDPNIIKENNKQILKAISRSTQLNIDTFFDMASNNLFLIIVFIISFA